MNAFYPLCLAVLLLFSGFSKTFAQTFVGQGGLPFPPGAPAQTVGNTTSVAVVSGVGALGACLQIDNVTIDLEHTWVGDIALFLISPSGTVLELSSGNGGSGDNYQVTTFSDAAFAFITAGAPPFNGGFWPEGRQQDTNCFCSNANPEGTFTFTNTFDGENADGNWQLFLNDYVAADAGTLNSWSITFSGNGTSPVANPAAIEACDSGGGQATFNLASVNQTVNGNTGNPVLWYTDIQATNSISNPAAYLSGSGMVYAVVQGVGCNSNPVPVTLTVTPGQAPNPASLTGCAAGGGQATFDLTSVNNTVNGGSGDPVLWWANAGATVPINNPGNYLSTGGTVYATVNGGSCASLSAPVTLTVLPAPIAIPYPLNGCDDGSGTGTFDLTSIENFVNLSTGFTVNWFTDPAANNPIANPGNYQSAEGPVYAVVDNGICTSPPTAIPLNLAPTPNIGNATITPNPSSFCGPGTVSITFNMPEGGVPYEVTMQYGNPGSGYQTYTGVNVFDGSVAPFVINETTEFILTSVSVPNNGFCSVAFSNPVTVTVPANSTPTLILTLTPTLCAGETFDLSTVVSTPSGLLITFHTATPPTPANQLPSPVIAPAASTIYYAFVDDGAGCTNQLPIPVTVTPPSTPQLTTASVCEDEPSFALTALQDPAFPTGTWSGPGVSGASFSPAGLTGTVTLTFDPSVSCSQPGTTTLTVLPQAAPTLGTADICASETSFNLTSLQDPAFPGGAWSGPGVAGSSFNATGLSGPVVLSYTPVQPCAIPASTTINVTPSVAPVLGTDVLCSSDPPYHLDNLADAVFPNGAWSGPGVTGNFFNPSGLSGVVTLTFLSDENCAVPVFTTLSVAPSATPQLANATVCESEASFALTALQDPAFPTGTWSGPGVSGASFSPAGLTGTVTLSFAPFAPCTGPGATTITILPEAAPSLGTARVCTSDGGVNLTALQDPAFPTGAWSGPSVAGTIFNPQGQSGPVALTFTPNSNCGLPATTIVSVNQPPATAALDVACFSNNVDYTVSFNIIGGDPGSYVVNGQPSGPAFASPPIPSGSSYSFLVDDGNGCGPVTVTGSFNCDCVTFAGSMNQAGGPVEVCSDETFTADFNNNALLDGNDVLLFVLHDAPGGVLGNVLAVSSMPTFGLPAGGQLGVIYYISAVAGNGDGGSSFDPSDGCLSVASGVPAVFYEVAAGIGPGGSICTGDCYPVGLSFNGVAPFVFSYEAITPNGSTTETLAVSQPNTQLAVCPDALGVAAGQISIRPISLTDANGCNVSFPGNQNIAIEVLPEASASLSPTLCPGESRMVNGVVYDESNPAGTEVFPNGSVQGCDSTVNVNLSFYPEATGQITQVLCTGGSLIVNGTVYDEANPAGTEAIPGGSAQGCDSVVNVSLSFYPEATGQIAQVLCTGGSLVVNGTVYDQANPTGVEILPNASANGCDSLVEVALSFNDVVSFGLTGTLCPGESRMVNGVVYDEANPVGTEVFPNGSAQGCDSIVNVNLSFYPEAVGEITTVLCPGGSLAVNGTVYDEANPAGTEVIPNGSAQGCDSIVNVSLSFYPEAVGEITTVFCPGGSLAVNGTVYDEANPAGTEVIPNGSAQGCDSIVNVSLSFYPEALGQLSPVLCTGGSVIVNGTVYNEANPSGMELLPGAGANGCDSLVEVALSFNDAVGFDLTETLCPGESRMVNGVVYDEATPAGTEVFLDGSAQGCDSIVNVSLSFYPEAVGEITTVLCPGGSLAVNGTVYDEANPAGTEVIPNGSAQGCDSIVNVSLSFYPEAVFELVQTIGPGGSIIVNGTVYDEANPSGTEVLDNAAFNGCDSMVLISLSFEAAALTLAASAVPPTCVGEEDGQVIIESISGGDGNYFIALNGQMPFAAGALPAIIGGLPPGSYRLEVSDGSGLAMVLTATVPEATALFLDLGDDVLVELGSDVPLNANTNINAASILWEPTDFLSCTDCLSPVVEQPTAGIRYRLILTDGNGCTASDEVEIALAKRRDIFIPNTFSPNGDGRNDRLTAFTGADAVLIRSFRIFDRWGGAVFEQSGFPPNDPSKGWDGTHRGEPLNAGVFVCFAEVEFLDGTARLFRGEVLLMR
ncbi:MAG: proprotein convertase P-domain-containing protein [Phaeodactylibacter sp.]|nr:proprotein convertase P-domain-containing protein [Phaeodactylibacter sp.]